MRTEVTNAQYAQCVAAGVCSEPVNTKAYKRSALANHPVVYVSLEQAREYAAWVGGSLPTEAQWLWACQGNDRRMYPWGNEPPDTKRANYADNGFRRTMPVGAYPTGRSPYGAADMAGNVWEWAEPDNHNGERYIVRGGQFNDDADGMRCAMRSESKSSFVGSNVGFRVVIPEP